MDDDDGSGDGDDDDDDEDIIKMGHLLFDLLDFLKKRQSVFHKVFSGHILLMMAMMRLMKRMMLNDENENDDDVGHKQLSAVLK